MADMDLSVFAAMLGRRGGLASKRGPGALRRILLELCDEIGSTENRHIFDYWQTHDTSCEADNAQLGTCWFRHGLWADPHQATDPMEGSQHSADGFVDASVTWDTVFDGDYRYFYFDGEQDQFTNAHIIRQTMCRIRSTANRLTATCDRYNEV